MTSHELPAATVPDLPPIERHLDEVQAELDELMARTGMPGAQLGLTDGTDIWTLCAGVTDLSTRQPVAPGTRFYFASLTKTITATLAMTLVDEGLLDLAAPPSEYLPGLVLPRFAPPRHAGTRRGEQVTVGDLLSHSSGLSGFFDPDDEETAERAVRRLAGDMVCFAPPGRTYSLNNSAFLIAAACVERICGSDWHDLVMSRVLKPVGAVNATTDRNAARAAGTARGHVPSRTGAPLVLPVPLGPPALDPAAGIYGTVSDALAVARDHLTGPGAPNRVLSPAAVAELDRPRVGVPDPYWSSSSLGWLNSEWGVPVLDSRGADGGQETVLRLAPASRRGLALFATSWTRRWPYFDVLPHTSRTLLGVTAPTVDHADLAQPIDRATAARVSGTYLWESAEFHIGLDGDVLVLSSRNRGPRGGLFLELDRAPLGRVRDDVYAFWMPNVELPVGLGFSSPDEDGRPQLIHLLQRTARRT